MPSQEILWLSQLALSSIMLGVIWQVQLLTYPQFLNIPETHFARYHRAHSKQMGWLVVPLMTAELAAAGLTAFLFPGIFSYSALALVLFIWASTGLIQVPLHQKLTAGWDETTARKLISTNWIRTILWTLRTALLIAIFSQRNS